MNRTFALSHTRFTSEVSPSLQFQTRLASNSSFRNDIREVQKLDEELDGKNLGTTRRSNQPSLPFDTS